MASGKEVVKSSRSGSGEAIVGRRLQKRTPARVLDVKLAEGGRIEESSKRAKGDAEQSGKPVFSVSAAELKLFRRAARQRGEDADGKRISRRSRNFLAKAPRRGKSYLLDLRIHSAGTLGYFSAGGIDPGPALLRLARAKGLDLICVSDYHDVSYLDSLPGADFKSKVAVLPGIVLRCSLAGCDEIFVITLYPETATREQLEVVLQQLGIPDWAHGRRDYCVEREFADVLRTVESQGGLVIPSRVDRTPYRQLAIPALVEDFGIHAFDLVYPQCPDFFEQRWPSGEFTFFSFSSANALGQIGSRTAKVKLSSPSFEGIRERIQRRV